MTNRSPFQIDVKVSIQGDSRTFSVGSDHILVVDVLTRPHAYEQPHINAIGTTFLSDILHGLLQIPATDPTVIRQLIEARIRILAERYAFAADEGVVFTLLINTNERWMVFNLGTNCILHVTSHGMSTLVEPHSALRAYLEKHPNATFEQTPRVQRDLLYVGKTQLAGKDFSAASIHSAEITLKHDEWLLVSTNPLVQTIDLPPAPLSPERLRQSITALAQTYAEGFDDTAILIWLKER